MILKYKYLLSIIYYTVCRYEKYGVIAEAERLYLVNIYRAQQLASSLATTATVLSLMDGLVMGSGTMFGLNSSHSLATERTVWALPEVARQLELQTNHFRSFH